MLDQQALRKAALNYLSRRDYSRAALAVKLQRKGASAAQVAAVLDWCLAQNYLNEERFLLMIVRNRCNQGYGYRYILQECRQHQLTEQQLNAVIAAENIDWWQVAKHTYQKKFADKAIADYQDKVKRMAYLQRRGFSSEQIRAVFDQND
ncbi:regulatory protein RecX [Alishewanella longhuensis]|uniref:Regulatory protein RecX n=1 Tax=Alishewanella longhuensis TaxID=1091037 RepID=A0ABQ3KWH1_9ALTE|nr:regulatory protein RecX [Alishewanella longhuensis]GHG64971.1 regulatory protein RecX [Alishewanella longhuensis]